MNAENQANTLRHNLNLSGRVDVYEVAEALGLEVYVREFRAPELHEVTVNSSIAVAKHINEPERRWAIAHAIGHIVLHGQTGNHIWLRAHTLLTDKLEAEAEQFAYHLLVDEKEARREGLNTAPEIAERFGVPTKMVSRHLISYGA